VQTADPNTLQKQLSNHARAGTTLATSSIKVAMDSVALAMVNLVTLISRLACSGPHAAGDFLDGNPAIRKSYFLNREVSEVTDNRIKMQEIPAFLFFNPFLQRPRG
jgi:hypothetical protein|tara:strand:+ start:300 stop:617 length:318 start_codon:yes stop_codon:yes gene_type:complete